MEEDAKKPLFREYFREWCEKVLKEPFDALLDVQRSKLMARFFAEQVLGREIPRYFHLPMRILSFASLMARAIVVLTLYRAKKGLFS